MNSKQISNGAVQAVGRGAALFFGFLGLLALLGEARGITGLELMWIDLRPWPFLAPWWLAISTFFLVSHGLGFLRGTKLRAAVALVALLNALIAAQNSWQVQNLFEQGHILGVGIPLSLGVFLIMVAVAGSSFSSAGRGWKISSATLAVAAALALAFPWLQIQTFGQTDYRRPAPAAVVLGARAYADGTPSRALADRVKTACQLFHEGRVDSLIFSGGPGDGAVHETESMRRLAISEGVDASRIVVDVDGIDTQHTIEFLRAQKHEGRMLVVSHDFHLPRIKLAARLAGLDLLTVPAQTTHPLPKRRSILVRETAAYWFYLLRGLVS